ncbi:hypothetical protein like AT1G59970 [Hibiscus trionum]|uniref:Peptidase metallopeptidase domain-containing protein n=1 Tax=Hibiscus trionum TaxID=183268 RepID=A0A9W7IZ92_HIBTR|nr:hypothetical protein like AT1G59970 [Hibiscus trionum]
MAVKFSRQLFVPILVFFVLLPYVAKASPIKFESLQNLKQAQKGEVVNGIHQVKQFLKAFGYYPHQINLLDNRFDDVLESAIKTFQEFYHLNVTGEIDHSTIKAMSTPRCGVPDINLEQTSNGHNHGMFHFVSNYTFFGGNPRWSKYGLTYNFLPDSLEVVNLPVLRTVVASAFQKWASVSPFRFQEVAQGNRADIRIGFYRGDHRDGYPFDGPQRVLAHAFSPPDGRFHYDADESWSTNPGRSQIDLESVTVHELGHNLGLDHSQYQTAIMFPSIPLGTIKRNLGQDDVNGLRALYRY